MKNLLFSLKLSLLVLITLGTVKAQDIPQYISYYRVYDFVEELATDGWFELNSAVKPYSRLWIAKQLLAVSQMDELRTLAHPTLTKRQRAELKFFLNEFALELDQLPSNKVTFLRNSRADASLYPPAFNYKDSIFKARITPILGMHLTYNKLGVVDKRWYGAAFQGMIGKHFSIYGSLRDISHADNTALSSPLYLNDEPGYEYTFGKDYSDSRGGIKYANDYVSIGLIKDNVVWGDNYHGSNILSGRTPSFPMIYLQVKPAKWFELNYFHGWLVSNVLDSTNYYLENESVVHYRPHNKFMAANMLTFTPIPKLKLSIGNSIVYAERNVQAVYFIPIAFYKSLDHSLTKGTGTENQNSQVFLNISSRNLNHLHLYTSVFVDEVQMRRFKSSSPDKNPISYKLGAHLSNFPVRNVSALVEYTRTNILNYKHSIPTLSYASNSYNMGHYLGDNAEELYAALRVKPVRGLDFQLSYMQAKKGNDYDYIRRGLHLGVKSSVIDIISNPSLGDVIWSNKTIAFKMTYEVFHNAYFILKIENSDIQGFDVASAPAFGEVRLTAEEALNRFTHPFLQGQNTTTTLGFSFGF